MSGVSIATGVVANDALGGGQGRGLQSPGVLAQSAVPVSVTGTTSETVLATIPVPAGVMGVNGRLRVTFHYTCTNNVNTKTVFIKLGGTTMQSRAQNSQPSGGGLVQIANRGAANSQITTPSTTLGPFGDGITLTLTAVDTSVAQNLTISAQLGVAGDTVTLETYSVEILNP